MDALYDLKSDPYELHNLAGTLKQHLISHMVEIGEPKPIVDLP